MYTLAVGLTFRDDGFRQQWASSNVPNTNAVIRVARDDFCAWALQRLNRRLIFPVCEDSLASKVLAVVNVDVPISETDDDFITADFQLIDLIPFCVQPKRSVSFLQARRSRGTFTDQGAEGFRYACRCQFLWGNKVLEIALDWRCSFQKSGKNAGS